MNLKYMALTKAKVDLIFVLKEEFCYDIPSVVANDSPYVEVAKLAI